MTSRKGSSDRPARPRRGLARSDSRPGSCTPGNGLTRTRAPVRCPSSRRPATCSRTRNRRRHTSTCRSTGTLLAHHDPDRRGVEERVANLEGGAGEWRSPPDRRAGGRALHAAAARRPRRLVRCALRRDGEPAQALLRKISVELTWVDPDDPGAWRRRSAPTRRRSSARRSATRPGTCWTSRRWRLSRIPRAATGRGQLVRAPYLCRPIEWGADIVIHSATKFIGGHGTSIGVVVVEAGTFNWSNGRFPWSRTRRRPTTACSSTRRSGRDGDLMKLRAETLRDLGAALAPFNAFLFLQGRRRCRCGWTATSATRGRSRRSSSRTSYVECNLPGLPGSRYAALEKYLPRGAARCSRSTAPVAGPAAEPHRRRDALVPPGERRRREEPDHPSGQHDSPPAGRRRTAGAGVGPGTVRLSVGTESVEDLVWDLEQGFARVP